jgi:hypothetical protein
MPTSAVSDVSLQRSSSGEFVEVVLSSYEHEHAAIVGFRRSLANLGEEDAGHYKDEEKQEHNFIRGPISAICELAVSKYLNQYWPAGVWHKTERYLYGGKADVGVDIEVRSFRTMGGPTIRQSDARSNRIVWGCRAIDRYGFRVAIYGCMSARYAWESGEYPLHKYDDEKDPCIVIPAANLYKPWLGGTKPWEN